MLKPYNDEGLVAELEEDGTERKSYGYHPGSSWGSDPLFMYTEGQYYWYINDHLGTPQKILNQSGSVVWSALYNAYGQAAVDSNSIIENNLRFAGQYYDSETGLHYNWHRYYDPATGRYMTPDPIGLDGGMNLYAYVGGDPVNWIDPNGLVKWSSNQLQASAVAIVGASIMIYEFTSDCIDNKRAIVQVLFVGPSVGVGATLAGTTNPPDKPSGFHDFNDTIQPNTFNGWGAVLQGGIASGLGYGGSKTTLGKVFSDGVISHGMSLGFDESISFFVGSSTVIDVRWECCP